MSYKILLLEVATGIERWTPPYDLPWHEFWWMEGNMACDCNRRVEFARAAKGPRPADDPHLNKLLGGECGDGAYLALRAELADGTIVLLQEAS